MTWVNNHDDVVKISAFGLVIQDVRLPSDTYSSFRTLRSPRLDISKPCTINILELYIKLYGKMPYIHVNLYVL
jgi:hypothetical protein